MSRWIWAEVRLFRSRGVQAIIPTVLILAISGLALTLTVAVIARSPYTYGNLSSSGYDRTEVVYLGESQPVQRSSMATAPKGDLAKQGQALFIGCAACHGLKGQGAVVAPVIVGTDAGSLRTSTRRNPAGMPAYLGLTDQDFEALAAYLKAAAEPSGSSK